MSEIAPHYFTHDGLESLFMVCDIDEPPGIGGVSKQRRVLEVVKMLMSDGEDENERALSLVRELVARIPPETFDDKEKRFLASVHTDGWEVRDGQVTAYAVPTSDPSQPPQPASGPEGVNLEMQTYGASTGLVLPPVVSTEGPEVVVNQEVDQATSQRIFIVHGRDPNFKEVVARFVERQQYIPVILAEQASQGRTIFEKFLDEAADAAFAVVILAPEDVGRLRAGGTERQRARQNVIFELGYFVALLGRDRVVALVQQNVELPSDIAGVVYIEVKDNSDDWKMQLGKEMRAAGLVINFEAI